MAKNRANKRKIFIDTCYWISLIDPSDSLHDRAEKIEAKLQGNELYTTELVLVELLNALSDPKFRKIAAGYVEMLRRKIKIRKLDNSTFETGLDLYKKRPDKSWGHVDCFSFQVMTSSSISEAVSFDSHFRQAGFTIIDR